MYSLSRVLATRFSLTMFLALLLIGVWAYIGAERAVRRELDRGLRAALGLELGTLAAGAPIAFQPAWEGTEQFVDELNRFVAIRERSGTVVAGNVDAAYRLPLIEDVFNRARAGEMVFATAAWEDGDLRTVYAPVPRGSGYDRAVVQVAASLSPTNRDAGIMFAAMIGTVMLATVGAGLGAGWLGSRASRPVADIAREAAEIVPQLTRTKLTLHGDIIEYRLLTNVLNDMLDRLNSAAAAQRRIIDGAAHELRTPITALIGSLEVALRRRDYPEGCRSVLSSCLEDAERVSAINESLMFLARAAAGQVTPDFAETDLSSLITHQVDREQRHHAERTVETELEPRLSATADPKLLAMALHELIDNALTHTPGDARIMVRVVTGPDQATITIEDSGPNLPQDVVPHLFEQFYRADAARTYQHGSGLGLTVANAIVDLHGGTLLASRSERLGGLAINLTLPRRHSPSPTSSNSVAR